MRLQSSSVKVNLSMGVLRTSATHSVFVGFGDEKIVDVQRDHHVVVPVSFDVHAHVARRRQETDGSQIFVDGTLHAFGGCHSP